MKQTNNRCAIYGVSSAYGKPGFEDNLNHLKTEINKLIAEGINTFVTSSNDGYELSSAQYVLDLKEKNSDIHLVIVRPYPGYESNWKTKPMLNRVITSADMVKHSSYSKENYDPSATDSWIVSQCDTIICVTSSPTSKIKRLSSIDLDGKNVIHIPDSPALQPEEEPLKYPYNLLCTVLDVDVEEIAPIVESDGFSEQLTALLEERLTVREFSILSQRFQDGKKLQEIGNHYSISRERVRQILQKSIRKIKRYLPRLINPLTSADLEDISKEENDLNNDNDTVLNVNEIVIAAEQRPGEAWFNNFNELKEYLRSGLSIYNNTIYSLDNIEQAREDLKTLKSIRKKLTDKRKSLAKAYTLPIETVLQQLDELIDMVKEPYAIIDRMLKDNAKEIKRRDIMSYARSRSYVLGDYADRVLNSPSFFNPRWCNVSYNQRTWKRDVDRIITDAKNDINNIIATGNENTSALLGFYFDKLSLDGVDTFLDTLNATEKMNNPTVVIIDSSTGEVIETPSASTVNPPIQSPINPPNADLPPHDESDLVVKRIVRLTGRSDKIDEYLSLATNYDIEVEEY